MRLILYKKAPSDDEAEKLTKNKVSYIFPTPKLDYGDIGKNRN